MSGDKNNLDQKIVLNVDEYVKPLEEANQAQKTFVTDTNKGLTDSSKTFAQHQKQVKQWASSIKDDLVDFKNSFKENLATGAKALTLGLGTEAIRSAAGSAIDMALDAGKKFAELKSRVGGTEEQFKKWDQTVKQTAINTKTSLGSLQDAFLELSDSADPDQIMKFMDQIGQATMLAHGNGKGVSDFVKTSLQGQGRDFNKENVGDVLGSADLLRRKGTGFGSMESAMGALGGMNQHSMAVGKLKERDLAVMLAGASKATGDSGRSTTAIKELLDMNAKGQLSHVGGVLGKMTDKNGKFSLANLGSQQAIGATHKGKDDATSLEVFKSITGLQGDAAEGLFKMIRAQEKMNAAMADAAADTKTLGKSAEEAGDDLKDTLQQMQTKMIVGFEDILGGFQKPLQSLFSGRFGDALKQSQAGVSQAGAGIAAHPMLAGGALLATAAGGALITNLASKVLGGGGSGMKGIMSAITGKGATQHVWVDNAGEIRDGTGMSAMRGGGGGIPGGGAAGKAMGFMGKAAMVGAALEGGVAIGGAINDFADQHKETNKYGQDFNVFEKGIAKILPEFMGGMTKEQYQDTYTQKVVVEVHSTDGRFDVKPKKEDNVRSGRTQ